jgi:hypothetical protein
MESHVIWEILLDILITTSSSFAPLFAVWFAVGDEASAPVGFVDGSVVPEQAVKIIIIAARAMHKNFFIIVSSLEF